MPPPRLPKLNGAVERARRAHPEELYELRPFDSFTVEARARKRAYDTARHKTAKSKSVTHVPNEYNSLLTDGGRC